MGPFGGREDVRHGGFQAQIEGNAERSRGYTSHRVHHRTQKRVARVLQKKRRRQDRNGFVPRLGQRAVAGVTSAFGVEQAFVRASSGGGYGRSLRLRAIRKVAQQLRSRTQRRVPGVAARSGWKNKRGGVSIGRRPGASVQGNGRGRQWRDCARRVSSRGTHASTQPCRAFRCAAGSCVQGV